MKKMTILLASVFIFIITALLLVVPADVYAADDLRGPAFADPAKTQTMPDEWVNKPVKYDASVAGADLVVDLNQQLYEILLPIVNAFAKEHNLKIIATKGTCGKSAALLDRKETDIGAYCCPPGQVDRLPGLRFHTLGIIPLAILVNPDNPINDISLDQARRIFMGKIRRWSEVGGTETLIKTIGSIHCMARPGDWRLLLPNEDLFGPTLLEVGEMSDMIAHIANNRDAIGYEVMIVADHFSDRGPVKPLKIDGMDPRDLHHMQAGDYPFYRTFNITSWTGESLENPNAMKLVEHLMKKVETLDSRFGLVPASKLREAGWKFADDELTGEPN